MNAPTMRILIVDDGPLARERLASLIREIGVGEVVVSAPILTATFFLYGSYRFKARVLV
jgi:DNA-binding LytR/AlgR family response regulator